MVRSTRSREASVISILRNAIRQNSLNHSYSSVFRPQTQVVVIVLPRILLMYLSQIVPSRSPDKYYLRDTFRAQAANIAYIQCSHTMLTYNAGISLFLKPIRPI